MDKNFKIISLGGSLIIPNGGINHRFLKEFHDLILKYVDKNYKFLIIAGGGKICRTYQEAAKKISDLTDEDVDWLGIHVTHLNAQLLRSIFRKKAHIKVLTHYDEKENIPEPITVAAGWKPGHSTDFDSVMFAKLYGSSEVINLSNIEYVYDRDPNKFPQAKAIKSIAWGDFRKIVGDVWTPGGSHPFDPIASEKAEELGLKVTIMNGANLENFEDFLLGKEFVGTVIE